LIEGLGSTSIKALGFRDNWVFVGGKGDVAKGTFEKVRFCMTSLPVRACVLEYNFLLELVVSVRASCKNL
jgi:hypothetical protein